MSTLLWIVVLPLLASIFMTAARQWQRSYLALAVAAFPALALLLLLPSAAAIFSGEVLRYQVQWLPLIGLNFSLHLDGLSFLFSLLILCIGLLVILYARYYLSAQDSMARFYAFLMLFMFAMLGEIGRAHV